MFKKDLVKQLDFFFQTLLNINFLGNIKLFIKLLLISSSVEKSDLHAVHACNCLLILSCSHCPVSSVFLHLRGIKIVAFR